MAKINLQEPQCNRNATANFVNLIMTSTVCISGERVDPYAGTSECSYRDQYSDGPKTWRWFDRYINDYVKVNYLFPMTRVLDLSRIDIVF